MERGGSERPGSHSESSTCYEDADKLSSRGNQDEYRVTYERASGYGGLLIAQPALFFAILFQCINFIFSVPNRLVPRHEQFREGINLEYKIRLIHAGECYELTLVA